MIVWSALSSLSHFLFIKRYFCSTYCSALPRWSPVLDDEDDLWETANGTRWSSIKHPVSVIIIFYSIDLICEFKLIFIIFWRFHYCRFTSSSRSHSLLNVDWPRLCSPPPPSAALRPFLYCDRDALWGGPPPPLTIELRRSEQMVRLLKAIWAPFNRSGALKILLEYRIVCC